MIPRKHVIVITVIAVFLLCFTMPVFADEPVCTWKIATLAPKGVGWARIVADMFIPEMNKATDNKLSLKVYWGGVMGDDEDYVKKMHINQLDGAGMTGQGAILLCPEWAVVEIPFLFKNYDEVDYVRKKMTPTFDEVMENAGFKLIIWLDQDFDKLYSIKIPLLKLEDFAKAKIVTWYGPMERRVLERLGASPIPINVPEIPAALRSGIIDADIAPAIWMVGTQMYSVARYVNTMNIRYAPAMIMVTLEAWSKLPKKYQNNIMSKRNDVTARFVAGVRRDNKKCLDAMLKYGIKAGAPKPEEMEKIKKALEPVAGEMVDKLYSQDVLDEILDYIQEYRFEKKRTAS